MPQLVEIRDLNVEFPSRHAVKNVSFSAPAGKVTALIGPNGAGKSTALSAIAGLVESTGEVMVGGSGVASKSAKARARLLSLVPQNTELRIGFSARDVVAMGRYPHRGRFAVETADRKSVV